MDNELPLLAAIRAEKDHSVDDLLKAAADALIADGGRVAGFLQRESTGEGECCGRIELQEIATGASFVISQALGSGARGCRLDPQALAAVAGPLHSSLDGEPDLLILNRFGKGEAEGQGFRAAIEEACARGIPVLTAVREGYVESWLAFAGELGILLLPTQASVVDWVRRASSTARRSRDAA
ncbi:DUF2478 domain-containing protein [Rhizobium sp. ARZ01]|uniref:DUF2478 domain-containing protein n=1 Tax=Rhizobium sp. ARZ01 TaxID=2769313 RepID=UPI0017821876|nr:DUF2478 domain-containing protein [Rhizobium sp. ARZ01]MBD9374194.1 DUF2478 domain-containing protein [Rhizobium sp. ARZ01]